MKMKRRQEFRFQITNFLPLVFTLWASLLDCSHGWSVPCRLPILALRDVTVRSSCLSASQRNNHQAFVCESCGMEHIQWLGRCSSCMSWNTIKAIKHTVKDSDTSWLPQGGSSKKHMGKGPALQSMDKLMQEFEHTDRNAKIRLFSNELNRVLGGGGVARGSVTLIAGEPGVGKSTFLMQTAASVGSELKAAVPAQGQLSTSTTLTSTDIAGNGPVVYISGEETAHQLVSRARRLQVDTKNIQLLCDTDVSRCIQVLTSQPVPPCLVIVDSVQTMHSEEATGLDGGIGHIRLCAAHFSRFAKATNAAVFLVGHVTKTGDVAGPRVLEHMVDTVLYLEGVDSQQLRILRSLKNRFGCTAELGIFEMTLTGLVDVNNPSQLLISSALINSPLEGSAACVAVQGSRPILAEVQCLATRHLNTQTTARRASEGFPLPRLLLICAIIQKKLHLPLWSRDILVNVAGGLRVSDPCCDAAVAVAIVSSLTGIRVKSGQCIVGEIGLSGDVRAGKLIQQRIDEALKMGFQKLVVGSSAGLIGSINPTTNQFDVASTSCQQVRRCHTLTELMDEVLEGGMSRLKEFISESKRQKKSKTKSAVPREEEESPTPSDIDDIESIFGNELDLLGN